MGTGYVRNDSGNNIADGNVINASDLDGEFDAIAAALGTSGHTHDGTAAEGGTVTVLGPAQDFVATASVIRPKTDNTLDIGTSGLEFKDLFLDGKAYIDGFGEDTLFDTTKKIQFRDAGLFINSSGDGILDLVSDTELQVTAPTVDINASTAVLISNDLKLDSDAAVLGFGVDNDVTLTHVADTGLLLNSTMALQFNDASQSINAPTNEILDINATAEIELNATLVDINANLDVSGTALITGIATFTATPVFNSDVSIQDDLLLDSDAAVLSFGEDNEVTITHVADTGLLLNSTMALQFNDASQFINAPTNAILDINATDEIELNATLIDLNGNLDVSGTALVTGIATFTATPVFSADVTIEDDLFLDSDAAVIHFGEDGDVVLTHVADTGLLLGGTRQLQFNDASQFINAPTNAILDINATDEIELNATLIDVNGNLDASGTLTLAGNADFNGNLDVAGTALVTGNVDFNGDLDVDGTTNLDATNIVGAADINGTVTISPNTSGKDTFELSTSASNEARLRMKNVDTLAVEIRAGGTSYFNGGHVGVGTSSPVADFVVSNAGAAGIELQPEISTDTNRITNFDRTASAYMSFKLDGLNHDFQTSGTTRLSIAADGAISTPTAGTNNVRLGLSAGDALASGGIRNTVIGDEAGTALTTGDANTAVGYLALAAEDAHGQNTAIGCRALAVQDAGASAFNTAVGADAGLAISIGTHNTLIGGVAGDALTIGVRNVAVGFAALSQDDVGSRSTAIGYQALNAQNIGGSSAANSNNTAVGYEAGLTVSTGTGNTYIGTGAGDGSDDGANNVAVGNYALSANHGDENTAVGRFAGVVITGDSNTCLGDGAGGTITSGSFNVCLGTDAGSNQLVSGDNQLYISRAGTAQGNDGTFLYGNGSGQLQNGDNNANFITTSDRRIKKNITDSSVGLAEINQVQIRNFEYRTFDELDNEVKALNDGKGLNVIGKTGTQTGVIAQELQAILPSEVEASNNGTLSVKHENLNWALIKAVQELSTALDAAVARIATLEG